MGIWSDFINALDELRERKRDWDTTSHMSSFYDPCGDAEAYAKREIAEAEAHVQAIFERAVKGIEDDR